LYSAEASYARTTYLCTHQISVRDDRSHIVVHKTKLVPHIGHISGVKYSRGERELRFKCAALTSSFCTEQIGPGLGRRPEPECNVTYYATCLFSIQPNKYYRLCRSMAAGVPRRVQSEISGQGNKSRINPHSNPIINVG